MLKYCVHIHGKVKVESLNLSNTFYTYEDRICPLHLTDPTILTIKCSGQLFTSTRGMYTCIGVCICSDECVWAQQYVRHLEPAVGPDPRYRNCKHQTVELNQLIPHITHMLELRGASLGPHGITALPPPQSIIHMRYQMYGRGLKTATNTNHWILENPASCRHLALRIHVTYMTGGGPRDLKLKNSWSYKNHQRQEFKPQGHRRYWRLGKTNKPAESGENGACHNPGTIRFIINQGHVIPLNTPRTMWRAI